MESVDNKVTGLEWRKLDLHLHTGASHDFNGSVTPEDIVEKCIEADLDAIAVTDHNTGRWIDDIKNAARKKNLVIFPGVEITCSGGKSGIHILAIFDPSKGSKDVAGLLEELGIPHDQHGDPEALSVKSIEETIEIIIGRKAIPIPAHVNSSKGICEDMRGQQRTRLIQHSGLLALEATDFGSRSKRTIDFFDGHDPTYKRKLAVYQASDNPALEGKSGHGLEGIGTRPSYFKLDTIDLEGLRQCFIHPEARIRLEHNEANYARIIRLKIGNKGFLKDQDFIFHSGLNSIIGGKGVGKSLVIEFIRFCLGCTSSDEDLIADHLGKLDKQLGPEGTVELIYQTASGAKYRIHCRYKGKSKKSADYEVTCVNLDTGEDFTGDIGSICQVLAYSQTEVIKIAENKNAQLELIDRFIDEVPYLDRIKEAKELLSENDKSYCDAIEAKDRLTQIELDISTFSEQINNINQMLSNELFESMKQAEAKDGILRKTHTTINRVGLTLNDWLIHAEKALQVDTENASSDQDAVALQKLLEDTGDLIKGTLDVLKDQVGELTAKSQEIVDQWKIQFDELQGKYTTLVAEQGGDQSRLEQSRRSLQQKLEDLKGRANSDRKLASQLETLQAQRSLLLDELDNAYNDYYQVRRDKFAELTAASDNKLRLTLDHAKDITKYASRLTELLRGGSSAPSTTQRQQIAENILPRQFVDLVLQKRVDELVELANLSQLWSDRIIERLWSVEDFKDILSLQYSYFPGDVPHIQYAKSPGIYANLDELSVGQKCTALLIIALSEGRMPILIDQPEDALDIVTVWENISLKLLGSKQDRQFILTTHNSSVAVSADSDQFIVLEADADSAMIQTRGAIDRPQVKRAVIDHLEGGDQSYALRQNKLK